MELALCSSLTVMSNTLICTGRRKETSANCGYFVGKLRANKRIAILNAFVEVLVHVVNLTKVNTGQIQRGFLCLPEQGPVVFLLIKF